MNKFPISPLFLPANKLEWIEKTFAKGTDSIILDLEDSVPEDQKSQAREALYSHLHHNNYSGNLIVRVNPINNNVGQEDIRLLADSNLGISAYMLPKVEESGLISGLPDMDIIALLETPISIKNISEIASVDKVKGLALGGADLSASLGSTMDWDSLLYARSKIVLEAAINNLFSIDSPFMNIDNLDALQEESKRSKAMGFNGKAAIHPSQLEVIKNSFIPSEDEIEEAKEIIKAFNDASSAVIAYKGKMVDLPVILSMEKRLKLVGIDPKNID